MPPIFVENLVPINIDTQNPESLLNYSLPEIFDLNNDNYTVLFENFPDFLTYDNFSTLMIDYNKITENQDYNISVTLKDDENMSNVYYLNINVIYYNISTSSYIP